MIDVTGLIRVVVPSLKNVNCMPDITEGDQPGIDQEKGATSEQQRKQGGPPDQVAEMDDVGSEIFQNGRVGMPKIIIIALVACISISCYL